MLKRQSFALESGSALVTAASECPRNCTAIYLGICAVEADGPLVLRRLEAAESYHQVMFYGVVDGIKNLGVGEASVGADCRIH